MQIDTIQNSFNRMNGLKNIFLASGSSSKHPKNPHFDLQYTQRF